MKWGPSLSHESPLGQARDQLEERDSGNCWGPWKSECSRQPFEVGVTIPHPIRREVKAQRINGLSELQVKYMAGPDLVLAPKPVPTTPRRSVSLHRETFPTNSCQSLRGGGKRLRKCGGSVGRGFPKWPKPRDSPAPVVPSPVGRTAA